MDAYLLAAAVVYSLSGFSLAAWVYSSWLKNRGDIDFFWVYVGSLGMAALLGVVAFGGRAYLQADAWSIGLSIPAGIVMGLAATAADRFIVRLWTRKQILQRATARGQRGMQRRSDPSARIAAVRSVSTTAGPRSPAPANHHVDVRRLQWRFVPLMLAGALEEVVYRGTLVQASWLLPHPAAVTAALMGTLVAFSLSHIQYGWAHVWAKTPLGVLCLLSVLILDTLVAAIIAHVIFNARVCWDIRRASPSKDDRATDARRGVAP